MAFIELNEGFSRAATAPSHHDSSDALGESLEQCSIINVIGRVRIVSFRVSVTEPLAVRFTGDHSVCRCPAGGWFVRPGDPNAPGYWLASEPKARTGDGQGRIHFEEPVPIAGVTLDSSSYVVRWAPGSDAHYVDSVIWQLPQQMIDTELCYLSPVETQGFFVLGSHTVYNKPGDIYRHLVHGVVYEDRFSWPHRVRVCSENDAHGLHLIFGGMLQATGKDVYRILRSLLLEAVLRRQSQDGGFRHGEWTDGMESHYRLHCSAMHLMMDALSEGNDPAVRSALKRAAAFISDKYDTTDVGIWFYHDELETTEAGMQLAPFRWLPSRVLGKSPQNMLVLNTQLDTLIALERYAGVTGDTQYAERVESGFSAALAILALRPMEWLYRLVFSAIDLSFLPTEHARQLPLWKRIWKRIGWQVFIPSLPRIKTRFPRLVMPGGYIDRELSLQTWAFDYLAVNLMDLIRAARGSRREAFMPYVEGILNHCARTGVLRRWTETKRSLYSLGFFTEALILLNADDAQPQWDPLLAEGLTLCMRHQIGLPPSINGGNMEVHHEHKVVPQTADPQVVIANLSTRSRAICLVVNTGDVPITLRSSLAGAPAGWAIPDETLQPGSWCRLES